MICHRCLYDPVARLEGILWPDPLAHSVEHWSRKPKDQSSNHGGCNTIFHNCICICDNGLQRGFGVSLCGKTVPRQTCKSATEHPISRTRFLADGEYVTCVYTNQLLDTDSAGGNPL